MLLKLPSHGQIMLVQVLAPDDMVFRFTGGAISNGASTISSNLNTTNDLDGLHVARYTGEGMMGLGNTFGINASNTPGSLYNRPRSHFHMSQQFLGGPANELWGFEQITYRRPDLATNDIIGQGELETDGLRFGIDNDIFSTGIYQHLDGYLRWQEASSFVIQTEDNTVANIQSNERMRITSVGALALNFPVTTYIGLTTPEPVTRVGVSHNGSTGLTRPMSLMHLGYNIGGTFGPLTLQQGWRSWMDLGMLVSNSTDNIWIGLKPRVGAATSTNNEMDAVISWGNDAEGAAVNAGIDVMSFIYTADPISNLDSSVAVTQNGLEIARMYPGKDSTFTYLLNNPTNFYGRLGVGDFTATGVNQQPTHKLDVIGNGRFRYLPDSLYMADSTVNKIVMVDSMGVLRWASFVPSTFGASCSDTVNGKLLFDTKVDLNNENLYFTKNDSIGRNRVGIGFNCGDSLIAKLNVFSDRERINSYHYTNDAFNIDVTNQQLGVYSLVDSLMSDESFSVKGEIIQYDNTQRNKAVGVQGIVTSKNVKNSIGVEGVSNNGGYGGWFSSIGGPNGNSTNGVRVEATNSMSSNTGIYTFASGSGIAGSNIGTYSNAVGSNVTNDNFGTISLASGSNNANFGVFGEASGGTFNAGIFGRAAVLPNYYAGYFQGDVFVSGAFTNPSDQNLKENIETLIDSDSILNLLNPVSFDFKVDDYPALNLQTGRQFGLIAQEAELILPEIVMETTSPALYDSLGNITSASETFKTIDYTKLIPLLIKGHQTQDITIESQGALIDSLMNINNTATNYNDSLEQVVSDLNDRLTQLENCLSGILPILCQMNNSYIQPTQEIVQEQLRAAIKVNLSDRNSIVLNQNVPNPFAESTIITFTIPATVQKAQIHFYDGQGKLINSVDIVERGNGQLNVFANDLSSGFYTYSLVADGQIVSTKRMVKE